LEHLETLEVEDVFETGKKRFPFKRLSDQNREGIMNFRGYAGKLYGNNIKVDVYGMVFSLTTESD
jgi:sulfate adenylyltransferase subunit 1